MHDSTALYLSPQTSPLRHIRRGTSLVRYAKQILRARGIDCVAQDSNWGFWIADTINPRTGSTWHSAWEAIQLARQLTAV